METLDCDVSVLIKCDNVNIRVPSSILLKESTLLSNKIISKDSSACIVSVTRDEDTTPENMKNSTVEVSDKAVCSFGSFDNEAENFKENLQNTGYDVGERYNRIRDAYQVDSNKKRKVLGDAIGETQNDNKYKRTKKDEIVIEIEGYQGETVQKVILYLLGNTKALDCGNLESKDDTIEIVKTEKDVSIKETSNAEQQLTPEEKKKIEMAALEELYRRDISDEEMRDELSFITVHNDMDITSAEINSIDSESTTSTNEKATENINSDHSNNINMSSISKPMIMYAEMLKFCHEYKIKSPVSEITKLVSSAEITLDNLMESLEASRMVKSGDLYERCAEVARYSLANCQALTTLLLKGKGREQLMDILDELHVVEDNVFVIRKNVNIQDSRFYIQDSITYIIGNLKWKVIVHNYLECDKFKFNHLDVRIRCANPNSEREWHCEAKLEVKLSNSQASDGKKFCLRTKTVNHKFTGDCKTFVDLRNNEKVKKLFQGGCYTVEVKVTVENIEGIKNSLGHDCTRFWYKELTTSLEADFQSDVYEETDEQILLVCGKMSMVVPKNDLLKYSQYFNKFFNWERKEDEPENTTEAKSKSTKIEPSYKILRQFKISEDYDSKAVKMLFESLIGNSEMLEACEDIVILAEILRICDFYMINENRNRIAAKMLFEAEIGMENLAETVAVCIKLSQLEMSRNVAENLLDKCYHYAMSNLGSWQVILLFAVVDMPPANAATEILEIVGANQVSAFRSSFFKDDVEDSLDEITRIESLYLMGRRRKPDSKEASEFMMANNMLWKLRLSLHKKSKKEKYLSMSLTCKHPDKTTSPWPWECNVKFELRLYQASKVEYLSKEYETTFSVAKTTYLDKQFCDWNLISSKDDSLYLEGYRSTMYVEVILNEVKKTGFTLPYVPEKLFR